tara:strand:+ start:431 stop:745 length:315 start_codon:yes stop_codon:yes gene_type:complete
MSKSESIKNEIISVIGITTISYDELIDTIVRIYGTENDCTESSDKEKENSVLELSGVKIQGILNELLTPDIVTLATGVTNCPNASKVLQCIYKTGEGMVYILER